MNDATKIFGLYMESKQEPIMTTTSDGIKQWRLDGVLHREDGPAIEWGDGYEVWYQHGKYHRDNGPAVEYGNGDKFWYQHGKLHREDGPAIVYHNGNKEWYLNNNFYADIESWAKGVLHLQKKPETQDNVDELIAQVMQADLFD
jgi:hypothetical protein